MSSIQDRLNAMKQGTKTASAQKTGGTAKRIEQGSIEERLAKAREDSKNINGWGGAAATPAADKFQRETDQWVSDGGGRRSTAGIAEAPPSPVDDLTVFERMWNVLGGAGKGTASDFTNLGGTVTEGLGRIGSALQDKKEERLVAQDQAYLEQARRDLAAAQASGDEQAAKNAQIRINQAEYRLKNAGVLNDLYDEVNRDAAQKIYSKADALRESSQQDIDEAKEGLGGVGQFLVDAGVAGAQLAGDMGLAMLSGGSTLVPMAARVFGGSAGEARQSGADFGEQLAYGAGSALVSGLTEKLGNVGGVFKSAFGSGVLDKALAKVAAKPMGKLVASALSEGAEEMLEAVAQPMLQRLTYDPDAAYDADWMAEMLYSGAIGAVLGGAGAAISPSTYSYRESDVPAGQNPPTELDEAARETISEGNSMGKAETGAEGLKMAPETISENQGLPSPAAVPAEATERTRTSALDAARETLGESGYMAFEAAYRDGGDPSASYGELTHAYNDGLAGRKTGSRVLTKAQYDAMYEAGRADVAASIEKQAKQAGYATVHGKDSGLVYDEYVKTSVDVKTAKAVNTVAKALGIRVQFADSVAGGSANADILNGVVTIEKGNPKPVRFLFGHEITHRMQEMAPAEYARLREAVASGGWADAAIKQQQDLYARHGKTIASEAALDEAVADYVGGLLEDSGELERFIRKHQDDRTLLQKLRDVFRDLGRKLRGSQYDKQIRNVEKRLSETLDAAVKAVEMRGQQAYTGRTEARNSLKEDADYEREGTRRAEGIEREEESYTGRGKPVHGAGEKDGRRADGGIRGRRGVNPSFGEAPKSSWANTGIVSPAEGTAAHAEQQVAMEYGVPSFVIRDSVWAASGKKAKAFSTQGQIYMSESLPEALRGYTAMHEITHVMKQVDFKPYLGFIRRTPTMLHLGHPYTEALLEQAAKHRGIDRTKPLSAKDKQKLYDEFNAMFAGQKAAGTLDGRRHILDEVFRDFDAYMAELTEIQEAFKASRTEAAPRAGVAYDAETESVSPARFSLKTWNESDYVQERKLAAEEMAKTLGISQKKAAAYIDSVNSIAKKIAEDRVRLDYEASPGRSSFVSNVEYGGSIDFSTVCKKRRLFTGTFEAIQKALPNTALTAEEFLEIRSMMDKKGYEVSCGLCYVEGSRANMGTFTKAFLERYAETNPAYLPTMAEMNTPTGQEQIRRTHPEVYEAYEYFMNHYGRLKPTDKALFASQQKPKMYQLSTEYQGEILNKFRKKNGDVKADDVKAKNDNGGIRLQSFSDFEIIHLIDSMQVIMDMSRVGLAGQAYTKVPDFAWALGDTGLKINLSLIAKGMDSKGRLILDEKEGMSERDAMALREKYSDNVGTIIVVFTDRQLKAAMADERIDYIIPFHRSQWKTEQYEAMGLPANAKDFTNWQNEAYIEPVYNKNGKKQRPDNYMPNTYWDFSKSGKENAEAYLQMCAANNRRPKFHYLLVDNKDGSYSLQPDGSTDGYWKTLIDFKMYNNDGKGSPQLPVRPDFNMDEAKRMLREYTGGHNAFPAAQDVVDAFVSKYKQEHKGAKFSLKDQKDQAYMDAVRAGELGRAQSMVDHQAMISGYNIKLHHGTAGEPFYVFRQGSEGIHFGTIAQAMKRAEVAEHRYGYRYEQYTANDIRKNPGKYPDSARRAILDKIVSELPVDFTQEEMNEAYELIYSEEHVPDEVLMRYLDRAEQETRETVFSLNNRAMGKTPEKRVVNAYVKAQHPMVFDVDIGEWIPPKLAGILMDKIEGNTTQIYSAEKDGWVDYDPQNIQGIDLTEDDLYALRWIQDSLDFEDMARFLQSKGVDSIRYLNTYEGTRDEESYILLSPEQVKSADPVTYDDQGNVIPLSERFDSGSQDIRYSLKDSESVAREIARIQKDGRARKRSEADVQADIRAVVEQAYQNMVGEYGAMEAGEAPFRDVQVPKKTGKQKVSQTVRTVLEAQATPDEALPNIEQMIATGDFSYDVYTDKAAIADAESKIRHVGWAQALADWSASMKRGEVSKSNTTMGWALYNNAANSGDMKTALTVLEHMIEHQRNAAQALQATRILKKMSPETQLYQIQRSVESLQDELNERYGDKKAPKLEISPELSERYRNAQTQEERDEVMKDIYRDIGRQLPSRFMDKWNAWRYLAMLGNPRTHVRNVVGNAGFAPVVAAKNLTATAIEAAVGRVSGGKLNRTKSLLSFSKGDRALLQAAWDDFSKVQDAAMSGGKYSEFANANKYIEEGRVIFKNKALEAARKGNTNAMEAEDMWFSRPHYAAALASYCKQHGLTAEQIQRGKETKNARAYAIREAQKATYRDTNALSQTISELGKPRAGETNPVKKGVGVVMEGILPFRKTPANILARGLEYSPAGLLSGIKQAVFDVKRGKKTGAEAIDSIASGLTGTGLLALGMYLAAQGLVRGHGDDDDEKNEFLELEGHQAYALEIGDQSYTLDWLAPEALPFFVGVNLWEQTDGEGEELTLAAMLNAAKTVTEPLLEMSCLQSLNDVFDSVGYATSDGLDGLPAALASAATSYLTQGLPTILGQAERTGEDVRMTTYTEKNDFLTGDLQYILGKASARIPGWEYQQIPYIDAWGRTESSGSTGARAANNFLNPAYSSQIESSAMEEELLRLYEETGEGKVLPSRAKKSFPVNKAEKNLTADEYVKFAQKKGQTAYTVLTSLTQSSAYKAMDDTDKADAISKVYSYADAVAKMSVSNYKPDGWIADAVAAGKSTGLSADKYLTAYLSAKGVESLKNKETGKTITNSQSLLIMQEIYNTRGLNDAQRKVLIENLTPSESVRHYNPAKVKEELAKMRKQAK